jgi:hypothetical protein
LSRSLGSNAIDGLAGPRMAPPGGFRSFVASAANGEVAPIPAVHATTTEPLEPTAAIQAGARSRGAGHHLGAASARSSNIILATGSVGASARMS